MDLEVLTVGVLCGVTFVLASVLWHLYVQPELVLSLWRPDALTDDVAETDPHVLRMLRWAVGVVVFVLGFLTGAVLAFFTATQSV